MDRYFRSEKMKKKIFAFIGFVLFSVVTLYAISLSELRIIAGDGTLKPLKNFCTIGKKQIRRGDKMYE
jgi:hypothetical protein